MASNFFEGFAQGMNKGIEQRRLRDQMRLEDAREKRREAVQQEQFQQRQQLQERQFKALEEFRNQQNKFRETQMQMQVRQADLQFATGFMKAFDPKIPKSARRFLLGSMARHLGVDPKSQQFKDFDTLVGGLEDENLDALRGTISAILPESKNNPGMIMDFAKTIMSGQMTLPQLMEVVEKTRANKSREEIIGGATGGEQEGNILQPTPMSGAMPESDPIADRQGQIEEARKRRDEFQKRGMLQDAQMEQTKIRDLQQAGEFEPELQGEIEKRKQQQKQAVELEKPVSPAITRILGLPGMKMTEGRARELGIATDILDAKTLKDINVQKAAAHTTIRQIEELQDMIVPGAIGPVGAFARATNAFMEQALAIPDAGGLTSAQFNKAVKDIIPKELAERSAVIRSRMTDLAFNMAKAVDGGRLSNQDVERFQQALGESGSESQFIAVLDDMKERLRSGAATDIEAVTGVKPIDLMTLDELDGAIDEIEDVDMLKAIIKEQKRRGKRKH